MTDPTAEAPAIDKGLIFQNIDTLRAIKAAGADGTKTELARTLARDPSSLNKTIQRLIDQCVVADFANPRVTPFGDTILAADDLAEGRAPAPNGDQLALRHDQIRPNPDNDRRDWTSEDAVADLAALAADIVQHGLLQNLVVRADAGSGFVLVGGERRWRAIGQLIERGEWDPAKPLPARLFEADDVGNRLAALAENLQRRALNPIEEAKAYQGLRDAGLSTDDIAQRVVMTPRHVQYRLALLTLSEEQQRRVALPEGDKDRISISDARKLVQASEAKRKIRDKAENEFTPRQRLILAELSVAQADYVYTPVEVDGLAANADEDAIALEKAGLLTLPTGVNSEGAAKIRFDATAVFELRNALFEGGSAAYATRMRAELGLPKPEQVEDETPRFSTPWLNGPFELTPELQAQVDADKAKREAEEAERIKARQAHAAEQQAQAERRAMGRAHAEGLFTHAAVAPAAPILDDLKTVATALDHPLPWSASDVGQIIDAAGDEVTCIRTQYWGTGGDHEVTVAMMTVIAVNTVAGFETPPLILTADAAREDAAGAEDEPEGDNEDLDADPEAEPA